MKVFVDTSAWLDFIRVGAKSEVGRRITTVLEKGDLVYSLPVVAQEVLQGFRSEELADEYADLFEGLTYLPFGPKEAREAATLYRSLRRRGVTIQTVDAQIAATCIRHKLKLITLDKDFRRIEGLHVTGNS